VVTLKLYEVFVAPVFFKHLLRMVRKDESILFAGREKCWDKTLLKLVDRFKVVNVEIGA
jgi:hypothetical protein